MSNMFYEISKNNVAQSILGKLHESGMEVEMWLKWVRSGDTCKKGRISEVK